jgi:hypothetical protein
MCPLDFGQGCAPAPFWSQCLPRIFDLLCGCRPCPAGPTTEIRPRSKRAASYRGYPHGLGSCAPTDACCHCLPTGCTGPSLRRTPDPISAWPVGQAERGNRCSTSSQTFYLISEPRSLDLGFLEIESNSSLNQITISNCRRPEYYCGILPAQMAPPSRNEAIQQPQNPAISPPCTNIHRESRGNERSFCTPLTSTL